MHFFSALALLWTIAIPAKAAITEAQGWFESAYAQWEPVSGASTYNVYVKPEGGSYTQLDWQLVRKYPTYFRADAVGLKAGTYSMKVVPVDASGNEITASAMETGSLTVTAHDRSGFAHVGMPNGIGAYKNDGTLKDNARIIYVTANNAKTVKCYVMGDSDVEYTGLQAILAAFEKGKETRPLAIRIIGTVKKADLDAIGSSEEGLQVKGKNGSIPMNITIEGIGNDATVHGFGFLVRNANSFEMRNFASMICMDDCISLDTDNHHCWIHNMDFFYGGTGSDADQAKGDGTVDIKGKSSHITVSYNHFFDSGKCSLGGMKSETTDCWMTYHHNWFDHSDSRHPRIRTAFYHCYNNYYDGVSKYGVGCTMGGSAFVENNYFRNTKYPVLISKQGTDAEGDGTFSGEAGGVIKIFNNKFINPKKVQLWSAENEAEGLWDAVQTATRDGGVTAKAFTGGTSYNSAADAAAREAVPESAIDPVENVALICRGEMTGREGLGAGRINGGDFKWEFYYPTQDANYGVIAELKTALLNYQSTLVGFANGESISNGGATETISGGDGKGKDQKIGEDTNVPTWGGGDVVDTDQKAYIIGIDGDFYWFNADNDTQTKQYNTDGIITWDSSSSYGTDKFASSSSDATFSDPYVGAIALTKTTGYATFYCPDLISAISLRITRAGSAAGDILTSADGVNFNKVNSYSCKKKGTYTLSFAFSDNAKYVRITNTSNGTLYIHGLKLYTPGEAEEDLRAANDLKAVTTSKSLNIGETYVITKGTDFTTSSTGAITFTSINRNVATVAPDGTVTAVAEGTTSIIISQAGTETIKSGSAVISITVSDPRAASSFTLTSNASVTTKEGETSQITTTGAAGAVTYQSSNTSVATVSESGLITAVAAGTATITITDAGTAEVKGAKLSVSVVVTKEMSGTEICSFNASTKSPSMSNVVVTGNYSNSKGTVTYNGQEYSDCVKMESSTNIAITPMADCKITLVFGTSDVSKRLKLDNTTFTTDANGMYSFNGTAGTTYTLTKGDSINLFLIIFEKNNGTGINEIETDNNANNSALYDIQGRRIVAPVKGQIYIVNGKKFIGK